ncbi:Dihydropteroate synthase [Planctomycetes bacterium Pan216]|uniref:Dihydropteroate synthase n=1 Tax=Kolteria novifilia TaxID=2527975 RepID=A0A518BC20_9BACT|nr:Dihydropteroate synthase [Planctomycetes bacterium Pan216]
MHATAMLRLDDQDLFIGPRPLVMGIVNVTPDSFSDGGEFLDADRAVAHAKQLAADGADWLDLGGESTRPGAEPVDAEEELRRVIPVIEKLTEEVTVPISIDTYKPDVARLALNAGATIINDVTGFRDPRMIEVAAESSAACVVMHMRGTPKTMNDLATYDDVVGELIGYFEQRMRQLEEGGVARERVVLDPGIGFAKRRAHNLTLMKELRTFDRFGRPILLGASRKRIIGEITGRGERDRLAGSITTAVCGYLHGAQILRVHDVAAIRDALDIALAIEENES